MKIEGKIFAYEDLKTYLSSILFIGIYPNTNEKAFDKYSRFMVQKIWKLTRTSHTSQQTMIYRIFIPSRSKFLL